jgi:hypothetical protein
LCINVEALAGPFASKFPRAKVWLQPGQWTFPFPLPSFLFGFPLSAETLGADASPPWKAEIAFEVLEPLRFKAVGCFAETAFIHQASGTLLVTDAVIKIDKTPPEVSTYGHFFANEGLFDRYLQSPPYRSQKPRCQTGSSERNILFFGEGIS